MNPNCISRKTVFQSGSRISIGLAAATLSFLAVAGQASAAVTPTISVVSAETGLPAFAAHQINGEIYAARPDGDGGFVVGGSFTCIGPSAASAKTSSACLAPNTKATSLARIMADGSIDQVFLPKLGEGSDEPPAVLGLSVTGSEVRIVGNFESVAGQPRSGAASISLTGEPKAWAPRFRATIYRATTAGLPTAIETAQDGSSIIGGYFDRVNGSRRSSLARVDANGALMPFSSPVRDAVYVSDIARVADRIYITGVMDVRSRGKTSSRSAIALRPNGTLIPWRPFNEKRSLVWAVEPVGDQVVFGGGFRSVSGKARRGLAAFDSAGRLTGWAPRLGGRNAYAGALAAIGTTVFAAGQFSQIDGVKRSNAAAADSAGKATGWAPTIPKADQGVVSASGDRVLVGYSDIDLVPMSSPGTRRLASASR